MASELQAASAAPPASCDLACTRSADNSRFAASSSHTGHPASEGGTSVLSSPDHARRDPLTSCGSLSLDYCPGSSATTDNLSLLPSARRHAQPPAPPDVPSWDILVSTLDVIDAAISQLAPSTKLPPQDELTHFHSVVPVEMPLRQYAHQLVYHCRAGTYGLALAIALMVRRSASSGELPSVLTAHRLFIACLTVGVKTCGDLFYRNEFMSRVGGVSIEDLNNAEVALLSELGWHAVPTPNEMLAFPKMAVDLKRTLDANGCAADLPAELLDAMRAVARKP